MSPQSDTPLTDAVRNRVRELFQQHYAGKIYLDDLCASLGIEFGKIETVERELKEAKANQMPSMAEAVSCATTGSVVERLRTQLRASEAQVLALREAIKFPSVTSGNASALAWQCEQGVDNGGVKLVALAKFFRSIQDQLQAYAAATASTPALDRWLPPEQAEKLEAALIDWKQGAEHLRISRDAWKACAEELENALRCSNNSYCGDGYGQRVIDKAISSLAKLKGKE